MVQCYVVVASGEWVGGEAVEALLLTASGGLLACSDMLPLPATAIVTEEATASGGVHDDEPLGSGFGFGFGFRFGFGFGLGESYTCETSQREAPHPSSPPIHASMRALMASARWTASREVRMLEAAAA